MSDAKQKAKEICDQIIPYGEESGAYQKAVTIVTEALESRALKWPSEDFIKRAAISLMAIKTTFISFDELHKECKKILVSFVEELQKQTFPNDSDIINAAIRFKKPDSMPFKGTPEQMSFITGAKWLRSKMEGQK